MAVPDFARGVKGTIFPMVDRTPWNPASQTASAAKPSAPDAAAPQTADKSSVFDSLLDIVNPLQHLPIVSTLYRASSGDQIGDFEQIAGDTLYGGPFGLVTSLADLAFKDFTGKNIGDTVLAMLTGDSSVAPAVQVAANGASSQTPPAASAETPASRPPTPLASLASARQSAPSSLAVSVQTAASPDLQALQDAIRRNGLDADLGLRATLAYQRSVTANGAATTIPR